MADSDDFSMIFLDRCNRRRLSPTVSLSRSFYHDLSLSLSLSLSHRLSKSQFLKFLSKSKKSFMPLGNCRRLSCANYMSSFFLSIFLSFCLYVIFIHSLFLSFSLLLFSFLMFVQSFPYFSFLLSFCFSFVYSSFLYFCVLSFLCSFLFSFYLSFFFFFFTLCPPPGPRVQCLRVNT